MRDFYLGIGVAELEKIVNDLRQEECSARFKSDAPEIQLSAMWLNKIFNRSIGQKR